jgi:glyoxylase-like metal-dependent hydrolase (beta-lactamase superfamily II)
MHYSAVLVFVFLCTWVSSAYALEPKKISDDVYAFIGSIGDIAPGTGEDVGNSGFIVGSDSVLVVDTGLSYRHGRDMLDAIRKTTDKPIKLVIITHADQEFLFGNAAFSERGVPLLTHAKSAALMRERCDHCLENLNKILGADAMKQTRLVIPSRTIEASTTLHFGGRSIDLIAPGWGSTPGDLAVFDQRSGVLFAGGLVSNGRIPQLRDGTLAGWLSALNQLHELPVRLVVPGYGESGGPALLDDTAAYLRALDTKVQALYHEGIGLSQAIDEAILPDYAQWSLYSTLHRQNALHRYLQLEIDELGG